jgi:glutaredoxin
MVKFKIYGKTNCSSCISAKQLLEQKGKPFEYLVFGKDFDLGKFTSFNKSHKSFPLITVIEDETENYLGSLNTLQQLLNGDNL